MPGLKPISGETVIKILSKQYGFVVSGQTGSHVRLSKATPDRKMRLSAGQELKHPKGAKWVPSLHGELKIGTLRGILKLAKIDPDDFARHI